MDKVIVRNNKKKERKKRLNILLFLLIGTSVVSPLIFFIWMHLAKLEMKDADALIVLGYRCDDDQIHPLLKERLDTTIFLFENYQYRFIIVTGGAVASTKTEAEIMKNYLVTHGIPENKILLETAAKNTVYNIVNCRLILKANHLATSLLISNSFHIRRIRYIMEKQHLSASFYAPRNIKTIMKQFRKTFEEIRAFKLTLPWLKKIEEIKRV